MVGKYLPKVNYSYILNYYDENDVLRELPNTDSLTSFESIRFSYRWNHFPRFEMTLSSSNWSDLIMIKTFRISIIVYEKYLFECDLGVLSYTNDGGAITYYGYCTHIDNVLTRNTRYLGDNLLSSLDQILGIMDLELLDENLNNYNGQFFQFNETNVSILLKLLAGINYDKPFVISSKIVRIVDLQYNLLTENVLDSKTAKLVVNDNQNYANWSTAPTGDINGFYYGQEKLISRVNIDSDMNYLYNKNRYSEGLNVTTVVSVPNFLDYKVGESVKVVTDNSTIIYLIVSSDVKFENQNITTTFELGSSLVKFNELYKSIENKILDILSL